VVDSHRQNPALGGISGMREVDAVPSMKFDVSGGGA
jgi:hypothetical protein